MMTDFEILKKQLKELSEIVNSFKSEAVQLRVVELCFQLGLDTRDDEKTKKVSNDSGYKNPRKSARKKVKKDGAKESNVTKKSSKRSTSQVLTDLIGEGFFDKPKQINEIVEHCGSKKGWKFKASDLSTPLVRFVRDKKLDRNKNENGQYEYTKK